MVQQLERPPPTRTNRARLPGGVAPRFSQVGYRAGWRFFFSRGSPVPPPPPPPHSGAAPHSPHFALIGSQDLDVRSRPNLPTQLDSFVQQHDARPHAKITSRAHKRGEITEYLSVDTVMGTEQSTTYPVEFVDSLQLSANGRTTMDNSRRRPFRDIPPGRSLMSLSDLRGGERVFCPPPPLQGREPSFQSSQYQSIPSPPGELIMRSQRARLNKGGSRRAIADNRTAKISLIAHDADALRRNLLHLDWLQLIATHRITTQRIASLRIAVLWIQLTAYPELLSASEAEKRGSDKGDTATHIKSAVAAKRKALNWRECSRRSTCTQGIQATILMLRITLPRSLSATRGALNLPDVTASSINIAAGLRAKSSVVVDDSERQKMSSGRSDQRKGNLRLRVSSSEKCGWQAGLLDQTHDVVGHCTCVRGRRVNNSVIHTVPASAHSSAGSGPGNRALAPEKNKRVCTLPTLSLLSSSSLWCFICSPLSCAGRAGRLAVCARSLAGRPSVANRWLDARPPDRAFSAIMTSVCRSHIQFHSPACQSHSSLCLQILTDFTITGSFAESTRLALMAIQGSTLSTWRHIPAYIDQ
ncbi:hypothetical protein PR048_025935 [Dryococelus australis]|uniref:Uncharacterized protein n=1 Tax=Dryococelus australis TaxID=614101 RepID=A0ABQ9GJW4_9NEOP|nr:hypothetical protein PR048_025935 [Dryococelus australis]